jgi:hypothetical protein
MADTTHHDGADDANATTKKKLSKDEVDSLTRRIYEDSLTRKQKRLQDAESKVYRVAEPTRLPKEKIEASVTRQVNDEMERRKRKAEELKNKFYKETAPKTMSTAEVEDSVRRIYNDAMRHKNDTISKLDKKHAPVQPPKKTISDDDRKTSADRLSKPKKTTLTVEEVNKIYGFQ